MILKVGQDVWVKGGSKSDEDAAKIIEIDTSTGEIVVNWSIRGDNSCVPKDSVRPMYDDCSSTRSRMSRRSRRVSVKPDRLDGAFQNEIYKKMSFHELKVICEERNLSKSGEKGELLFRIIKKEEENVSQARSTDLKPRKKGERNNSKSTPHKKKAKSMKILTKRQTDLYIDLNLSSTAGEESKIGKLSEIRRRRNNIERAYTAMKKYNAANEDTNIESSQTDEYHLRTPACVHSEPLNSPYDILCESYSNEVDDEDDDKTVPYPNNITEESEELLSIGVTGLIAENKKISTMIQEEKSSNKSSEAQRNKVLAIMESQNAVTSKLLALLHTNAIAI